MTQREVVELVFRGGDVRVSMSKDGIFLYADGRWHGEITAAQAEIVWDTLGRLRAGGEDGSKEP